MNYLDKHSLATQLKSGALSYLKRTGSQAITAVLLCLSLVATVAAQQAQQTPQQTPPPSQPPKQTPPRPQDRNTPLSQRERVTLGDVNTDVLADKRVIVMMAALNMAGYDYESGNRPLSELRQQLRNDLKGINPALVRKLRDHFLAHSKGKIDAASVAPYLSLALTLTEPPSFSIETAAERLPDDVREITDFALLLEEFYRETNFSKLLPKYTATYQTAAKNLGPTTAVVAATVISYLHTEPILELPPLIAPRPNTNTNKKNNKPESPTQLPMRERRFVVIPDLLNTAGAANLRVVRDVYYLLLGPTTEPNLDAVRRGFLSFVVDPMTERLVKEVAAVRDDLKKLLEARGEKADPIYAQSAYRLVSDSFVRAADARLAVLGVTTRRKYDEADAIYDLSLAYERGAVLAFHFYNQVAAFEHAGINLRDYYASMLTNVNFERESHRLGEYAGRLASYKKERLEAASAPMPPSTISNADEQIVARIVQADELIKARQYADARAILVAIRRERPNNARALFGLADVTSKQASAITDKDKLEEELFAAVELYKQAAQNASPETEKWLAQRSYVAAAKILDFLERYDDATAAYDLAIKLGNVPDGAYDEAVKAKQKRGK